MSAPIPAAVPPPARPALDRLPSERPAGAGAAGQFGILFVCTGNLCRSVIAEQLARRGLRTRLGPDAFRFRVRSAGTASLDGCPVHPYTAEALRLLGANADGAVSHALTAADVDAADLILTAGQEHRDAVVAMRPRTSRRAYLLREFARLAPFASGTAASRPPADQLASDWPFASPSTANLSSVCPPTARVSAAGYSVVDQARYLVAQAAQWRGQVPYVGPTEDEIADPATNSAAFLACARVIDEAVTQALDALCGSLSGAQYRGKHAR